MSGNIWRMAKTLYLMRHAKSSWDDPSMSDFERPLNDRGRRAAPFMGSLIVERSMVPAIIICSPAKRAVETARLVIAAFGSGADVIFDDRIYEASPHRLLKVVHDIFDKYASAMIVGHNPGTEGFIRFLTGSLVPMPTAALAVIDLNIKDWFDADIECGELRTVIRPRDEMLGK